MTSTRLAREAHDAGRSVLEMEDAVAEREGGVATAAAALAAVHVEVLDLTAGAGGRGPKQEGERGEQQYRCGGPTPHALADS